MTDMKLVLAVVATLAACKSAGMGAETRTDIQARMTATEGPISECYAASLRSNRKIKGMLIIDFIAEASTGQFKNVQFRRDEVNDTALRQCVVAEVEKQKLTKAPSANVQINYPFRFTPNN